MYFRKKTKAVSISVLVTKAQWNYIFCNARGEPGVTCQFQYTGLKASLLFFLVFFSNAFRQYIVITKGHCVHVFEVTSFSEHTNIYRMGKPVVGRVAVHHNRVQNKYDKL